MKGCAPVGRTLVQEVLELAGVEFELVTRAPTAKTLALLDGDLVRLVVIPAGGRLDFERARRALRAGPRLRPATAEEIAEDFPAFPPGELPPLGHEAVPDVLDLGLFYLDELVVSGGVRLDVRDLLRLCEPRVADVCLTLRTSERSPWRTGRTRPSA
jgi:prolyl-tRNA editing enzyme YbaK/EbsC (Cys-tRNA(Pro) deacylase)